MCIIAYSPANTQATDETIKVMFKRNPDGAGIMWKPADSAQIEIRKGFMNVESLLEAYHAIPAECESAIHCRIATSGKVSAACCHPFPVRQSVKAMRATVDRSGMAFMHNGVFSFATPLKGIKSKYSDTMVFGAKYLHPLQKLLDIDCVQTLIEESSTSRLLIFRSNADTIMLGDWQFADGIYYSNGTYKESVLGKYDFSKYEWDKSDYSAYYGGCYGYGYEDYSTFEKGVQAPKNYCISVIIPHSDDEELAVNAVEDELEAKGFTLNYSEFIEGRDCDEYYCEVEHINGDEPPTKLAGYETTWL